MKSYVEDYVGNVIVRGFNDCPQLKAGNADVVSFLSERIPREHLDLCDSFRYDHLTVSDEKGNSIVGQAVAVDRASSCFGLVQVFNHEIGWPEDEENTKGSDDSRICRELRNTLAHEIGHVVYAWLCNEKPADSAKWKALHQNGTPETDDDCNERFAEAYACYLVSPESLMANNRSGYDFMSKVCGPAADFQPPPSSLDEDLGDDILFAKG